MYSTRSVCVFFSVLLMGCNYNTAPCRGGKTEQFCPEKCHCTNFDIYSIDCSNTGKTSIQGFERLPKDVPIRINLSHNRIKNINKGDCKHLGQVVHINLSYNKLTKVHVEAFKDLDNLAELLLHGNMLNSFGISEHLPKRLESLSVDAHLLKSEQKWNNDTIVNLLVHTDDAKKFEPGYQRGLTKVWRLSIRGNNLSYIPHVIFQWDSSEVVNVEIAGHKIESLAIPSLAPNMTIGELKMNLTANRISNITVNQTKNYYQFQKVSLILSENDMDFVEEGVFPNVSQFGVLDLSKNRLDISDIIRLFNSIRDISIHALIVSDNDIDLCILHAEIFEPLRNSELHTLDISKNRIHSIKSDAFMYLPHLKELTVSNLDQPGVLAHLALTHLAIHGISSRLVKELFMSLPDSLESLTLTNIEDKYLKEKQLELKNGSNLKVLIITDSPVQFNLSIKNQSKLTELELTKVGVHLSGLKIESEIISNLTRFVFRNEEKFTGRDIIDFFTAFDQKTESIIEEIDFSNNDWSILEDRQIQKMIAGLEIRNLRRLRLSNCKFSDKHLVKGVFNGLPKVELVDLSENSLGHIPNGVFNNLSSLRTLYLQGNQITFIDHNNFIHLPHFAYLNYENNYMRCDCDVRGFSKWMRDFVSKKKNAVIEGFHSVCGYPIVLRDNNTKVIEFTPNEIMCDGNIFKITIPIITVLFLIIIGAVIVHHFWVEIKFRAAICFQDCSANVFKRRYKGVSSGQFSFDAYVIHHDTDLAWVMNDLLPTLEESPDLRFTLCLEERNFIPGNWREDNILRAVQISRKTILVISKALIEGSEGLHKLEIEFATDQFYEGRRHNIIVILLDHSISKRHIPKKLSVLLDYAVVLYWPRKHSQIERFWKELKLALLATDKYEYRGPLNHSHCTSATCEFCQIDTSKLLIMPDKNKGTMRSQSSPS